MVSIIIFILVLSILVLVHEAGHFFAARKAGLLVEEFGFGLPPRVWGKKYGETLYSINLLPFGGFVRIHGEGGEDNVEQPERSFMSADKKTRAAIIVAGVIMNFLLAIVAFSVVYSFTGIPRDTGQVEVVQVMEGSPAQIAGLKQGDVIKNVNEVDITSNRDFIYSIEDRLGEEVVVTYLDSETNEVAKTQLVPRVDPPQDQGAVGVVISSIDIFYPPIWQRPFYGMYYGTQEAFFWGSEVVRGFSIMIVQLFRGDIPKEVAGPVGIYALTSEAAQFGILTLINFVGILSINLAVLNIVPFPALDGGRLLFIIIESIFGKKILPRSEAIVHTVGIIVLLILIFAITATDIRRLIQAGGVSGYLDAIMME